MKIYIGSDHAGYKLKEVLKAYLSKLEFEVDDMGAFSYDEGDDYPDFIRPVAKAVAEDANSFGIIIGGSGQGEAICANRIPGARASVYYGHSLKMIRTTREHNNANILSLGARFVRNGNAKRAVKAFLETRFSEESRHVIRINKIDTE